MMMTRPAPATHNPDMSAIPLKRDAGLSIAASVTPTSAKGLTRSRSWPTTIRYRWLLLALLASLLPVPASAWNFAGHRLAACIAWEQLPASSRDKIGQLLRAHPDYARWTRKATDDARDRTAFIEASTWADLIRYDRRFHDAGEEATPALPGFPDMENHRDWHYVNRPLPGYPAATTSEKERGGELDRQLEILSATLGSRSTSARAASERSYALPWLIHLVADAHQPFHVIDVEAAWEAPLVDLKGLDPSARYRRIGSLHTFWDDLPGPSGLSGNKLDSACRALGTMYPPPMPSNPAQWIDESWRIAQKSGFPADYSAQRKISRAFFESAKAIANQRIAAAGYRLAELLQARLK